MRHRTRKQYGLSAARTGFTLTELIIIIAIAAVIGLVSFPILFSRRNTNDLTDSAQQIASLLRQAQNDSMAGKQGASWGVHFQNATATAPFYALFSSAYSATNTTGYYRLPATVGYMTSTLPLGSSVDIVFSQISGAASASTSIGLYLVGQPSSQSIISIASTGVIRY